MGTAEKEEDENIMGEKGRGTWRSDRALSIMYFLETD